MNPFLGYPPLAAADLFQPRDHVRVPDNRIGVVVGFYRSDEDLVLVRLDDGESRYARGDLRLIIS